MKYDLKNIIKGSADISCVISGGIVEYILKDIEGHTYQLQIDLSDTHDVGESASFMAHYDKSIILMRWIRKAIENETLIKLS